MDNEKLIKDTKIRAVKDTLRQCICKWSDTGKLVTYDDLLNVLGFKEPLSLEQAKQMYSSLSNDSRITKNLNNL
ncbi:hypothetical protein [Aquimarina algiphila]|uniref:hypothetical protein n=1 Tax=Aquimarina algiphila TaxID=2047982 RepID=UPI00232FCD55|nr:hypothetical protein [Aquimarina algiphila]